MTADNGHTEESCWFVVDRDRLTELKLPAGFDADEFVREVGRIRWVHTTSGGLRVEDKAIRKANPTLSRYNPYRLSDLADHLSDATARMARAAAQDPRSRWWYLKTGLSIAGGFILWLALILGLGLLLDFGPGWAQDIEVSALTLLLLGGLGYGVYRPLRTDHRLGSGLTSTLIQVSLPLPNDATREQRVIARTLTTADKIRGSRSFAVEVSAAGASLDLDGEVWQIVRRAREITDLRGRLGDEPAPNAVSHDAWATQSAQLDASVESLQQRIDALDRYARHLQELDNQLVALDVRLADEQRLAALGQLHDDILAVSAGDAADPILAEATDEATDRADILKAAHEDTLSKLMSDVDYLRSISTQDDS